MESGPETQPELYSWSRASGDASFSPPPGIKKNPETFRFIRLYHDIERLKYQVPMYCCLHCVGHCQMGADPWFSGLIDD